MTGGGKTLILAAQSDADLKANKQNTRYVGLYAWNGVTFQPSVSQNFDLFSKDKDGNYIYSAMQNHIENGTDVFPFSAAVPGQYGDYLPSDRRRKRR